MPICLLLEECWPGFDIDLASHTEHLLDEISQQPAFPCFFRFNPRHGLRKISSRCPRLAAQQRLTLTLVWLRQMAGLPHASISRRYHHQSDESDFEAMVQ